MNEKKHSCQQIAYFCDCCRNMVQFLCDVESVKRYVNVRLHCIVSNLERISKASTFPPHGKFLRAPMLEVYVLQIIFENTFVSHITVDMWAVGNMFISMIITL